MNYFEHRYILHIGILSIVISKKYLHSVLKILHLFLPDKCIFIEIK